MYIWDSICLNQEGIVIEHIFLQYRSLKLYTHNLSRLNYLEAVKFRTSSKFNYWKAIYWHIIYQYENVCFQINNNFHYILYVQLLQHFRYMITNVWIYHNKIRIQLLNHKICISYILQIITKYRFTLWTMLSYTPWFLWHVRNIDLYPIHCFEKYGVLNTRNWIPDQSLVRGKVYYMSHWSFSKMLQWFQRKEFLLISYFFF